MKIVNLQMIGGIAETATSLTAECDAKIVGIPTEYWTAKIVSTRCFLLNVYGVLMLSIPKNAIAVFMDSTSEIVATRLFVMIAETVITASFASTFETKNTA